MNVGSNRFRSPVTLVYSANLLLFLMILSHASAQGIRYVTREALKSPAPGLVPVPGAAAWNQIPAVNPFFSPARNPAQGRQGAQALAVTPPRPSTPARALKRRKNPGAGSAEYALALFYWKGRGGVRNLQASTYWLAVAARKGNIEAQKVLRQWAAAAK